MLPLAMLKSIATSSIGSSFIGRIVKTTTVTDRAAVVPTISGRGWITGTHNHMLGPADSWPEDYRSSDTWGAKSQTSLSSTCVREIRQEIIQLVTHYTVGRQIAFNQEFNDDRIDTVVLALEDIGRHWKTL